MVVNRQLENKSKLVFNYPNESGAPTIRTLAFVENVNLSEKRKTNFTKYNPIGNNGQNFLFTGADSRSFSLDFNLTLPHMMQYVQRVENANAQDVTEADYTQLLSTGGAVPSSQKTHLTNIADRIGSFDDSFLSNLSIENPTGFEQVGATVEYLRIRNSEGEEKRRKGLQQVMYCVNLIRTSGLTHSRKSYLGTPIVRLTHGMMYDDIPCVVESYSIKTDEKAGYDLETLLPNRLMVSMSLMEVRIRGRAYKPKVDGDYVPGWDSIVDSNYSTIDPGGSIGGSL